jgi:hypothetical protein
MQLTDFFVKGYYSDILSNDIATEFGNYKFVNCQEHSSMHITNVMQKKLDDLHLYLAETYVSKVFSSYKLLNNGMWDNVDSGSSTWHNDFSDGDALNSNILVYIDDNRLYNNFIMITNGQEEFKIQPEPNQFVWLNQSSCFQHKAIHNSGPRRLLSFEFFIDGLV